MALHRYPNTWRVHGNHPLHAEIRSAFDRFVGADSHSPGVATNAWTPRVDIKEESARFVILADIPGVDPKDIEITMDKGVLTIKGERKAEAISENGKLTRTERSHGGFDRRFALPDSADAEGIQAVGKHGVLEVSIPKRPELAPRRIAVN